MNPISTYNYVNKTNEIGKMVKNEVIGKHNINKDKIFIEGKIMKNNRLKIIMDICIESIMEYLRLFDLVPIKELK